jgi:hypothetical protein
MKEKGETSLLMKNMSALDLRNWKQMQISVARRQ